MSQRSKSIKGGYIPGVTRPRNLDPARSVTSSQLDRQTEIERFTEINENDEWNAIQKFNSLLYYEEQK